MMSYDKNERGCQHLNGGHQRITYKNNSNNNSDNNNNNNNNNNGNNNNNDNDKRKMILDMYKQCEYNI